MKVSSLHLLLCTAAHGPNPLTTSRPEHNPYMCKCRVPVSTKLKLQSSEIGNSVICAEPSHLIPDLTVRHNTITYSDCRTRTSTLIALQVLTQRAVWSFAACTQRHARFCGCYLLVTVVGDVLPQGPDALARRLRFSLHFVAGTSVPICVRMRVAQLASGCWSWSSCIHSRLLRYRTTVTDRSGATLVLSVQSERRNARVSRSCW